MNRYKHVCIILIILFSGCSENSYREAGTDWPYYGGNNAGNRYSPLDQINRSNVQDLKVAWSYDSADTTQRSRWPRQIQTQPIVIDGVLYGISANLVLFALDAKTGQELWKYNTSAEFQGYNSSSRGVTFWEEGEEKRIYIAAGTYLHAVDAKTGEPIQEFGEGGKLDLHTGLENTRENAQALAITATTPGVIYEDIIIMGSTVSEVGDALPGDIRGFDARTGELKWIFHTIPRPGEFGYDTWEEDAYKNIGGVNNWSGMVLDEERGVVYMGLGSPSPNFYGGDRTGKNLFSDSIVALDAETGELQWYFQLIAHDIWDLDPANPPNLVTVVQDGKEIDAVSQTTKDGLVYLLNRDTGESLFPIEERPVSTDGLPGEDPWPVQKFPLKPEPLARQVYTENDLPDSTFFPESYAYAKEVLSTIRYGEKFLPPSEEGTMVFGISGGVEWGGSSVDPDGILYQNSNERPWIVRMTDVASTMEESVSRGNDLYIKYCAACHGADRTGGAGDFPGLENTFEKMNRESVHEIIISGRGRMPAFQHIPAEDVEEIINFLEDPEEGGDRGDTELAESNIKDRSFPYQAPYIRRGGGKFSDENRRPAIKPPWGTLNAIDLNTGEYLWRVPLGEDEELTKQGVPITGLENTGGPLATAGGLVFIGATPDEKFRAFDANTGEIVWEYQLPAGAYATPISYSIDGEQYIAVAAGGARFRTKPGGSYIAFKLSSEK